MDKFKVLDLFSGIGGFSLGLERTGGFETVAFCEIEPYCRRVLAKHWPKVKCYEDIRTLTAETLYRDGIRPDVITGGFPCQDISSAGKKVGIEGSRSSLWGEYARLIGELQPIYAIVENVSALLNRGMGVVLGDLASLGYGVEWHCIPAFAVGAPHRRDRVWFVAYSNKHSESVVPINAKEVSETDISYPSSDGRRIQPLGFTQCLHSALFGDDGEEQFMAYSYRNERAQQRKSERMGRSRFSKEAKQDGFQRGIEWATEPAVGRVANGIPNRVDRLRGLGNAVVPQIPELIGNAILEYESAYD